MKFLAGLLMILLYSGLAQAGGFTDNHNGTVTDLKTGLIWQQNDDKTGRNWEAAMAYCEGSSLAGNSNWRLPNIKELESLVDYSRSYPFIDPTVFTVTGSPLNYWSSTTYTDAPAYAWAISFYFGENTSGNKTFNFYVRCVRSQ
jgi:hypothetical protein